MNGSKMTLSDNDKNSFIQNHVKIIANDVDITAGGSFKPTPNNKPDTIQYVCESGYKFDGDVYTRYRVISTGVLERPKMTDTSDTVKTFISNKVVNFLPLCNDVFNKDGVAVPYMKIVQNSASVYQLTKNLTNASVTPNIDSVTVGTSYTLDIYANDGYTFDEHNEPTFYYIDNEHTPHYLDVTKIDDTHYRITFTPDETDYILRANAVALSAITPLEKNLTNCSLSPNITELVLNESYTLIVTANAGYRFDVAPSLRFTDNEGTPTYYEYVKISDYEYRFNNVTAKSGYSVYTLTAIANAESQTSEKYGVLAIHKVNADNLKAINDLRYYNGAGNLSQIDLSKYFASLKVIYCDVATDTSDAIIVSNINTNVVAPKVTDDYTILNLGNVSLAGEYLNALDKKYSEITLNLPFVSAYKLDSAFMNETINIKYRVNLISGDVTVIISLVRNDTEYLIDTISGNMSFDLPFTYTINGETKPINANVNNPINFNVAPSVTIRQRLKADVYNSVYQCYKIDTPAHENGYFKIERLDADTIPASASIRNKIENLLKAGVYI